VKFYWLIIGLCLSASVNAEPLADEIQQIQREPARYASELSELAVEKRDAVHWFKLSHAYLRLQNKDAALNSINMALQLGLPDEVTVQALEQKALIYGMLFRNNQQALAALQQAETKLDSMTSMTKPQLQTSVYESFAQAYNQVGNMTEAIRYAELSIAIATEHQLPLPELQARLTAGRLALQQNNFVLTQLHLSRALTLAIELDRTSSLASIHLRLGMAYRKLAQHTLALEHFAKAEQFYQKPADSGQRVSVWLNQAETYLQMADPKAAELVLQKALALATEIQDVQLIALAHFGQAQWAIQQQQLSQARQLLNKSLQLFTQIGLAGQQLEINLAIVEVALQQHDLEAASDALPAETVLANSPDFLQQKYWQMSAQLNAATSQWQPAFIASEKVIALQTTLLQNQQKFTLDLLNSSLQLQRQEQQLKTLQQQQQRYRWLIVALSIGCLLSLAWVFRRRKNVFDDGQPESLHLPQATSWTEFSRKLQREYQKPEPLMLQCIQLAEPQQFKFLFGEQILRNAMQHLISTLPAEHLVSYTVHTDAVWVVWRGSPTDFAQVEQQLNYLLLQQRAQLPTYPTLFSFVAPLQPLLGQFWQPADLAGLRELIWLSWQQACQQQKAQHLYRVQLQCKQPNPCSWQAENVRADINNALRLGLISLSCNDLPLARPHD
jgi:tetratricopeptide (TPR) repeat protein